MSLIPWKLHRKIEKALGIEKGCCKPLVEEMRKIGKTDMEILEAATGCVQWMAMYGETNFVTTFSLFISCLKNPGVINQFSHLTQQEGGTHASAER